MDGMSAEAHDDQHPPLDLPAPGETVEFERRDELGVLVTIRGTVKAVLPGFAASIIVGLGYGETIAIDPSRWSRVEDRGLPADERGWGWPVGQAAEWVDRGFAPDGWGDGTVSGSP